MKRFYRIIIVYCLFSPLVTAGTLTDEQIGYSITLPDTWVREITSPTHHLFFDTTGKYQSIIAINRYNFSADTLYANPNEWTRTNFIAYTFLVNADTFSALVFYDTVTAIQNNTFWAADAYTYYFEIDPTIGEWAEYIRFTAAGTGGFELYAIGPMADLDTNIGYYAAIIDGISLREKFDASVRPANAKPVFHLSQPLPPYRLNLLGQRLGGTMKNPHASQIVVVPRYKACLIR